MNNEEVSFLGEYFYSLDAQRRVSVPKSWRSAGGKTRLFLMPGPDKTIAVLPPSVFEDFKAEAGKKSFANAKAARLLGQIASKACECVSDKQGRVAVSPYLKQYANLSDDVVMVGAFTTGQLMSREAWEARKSDSEEELLDNIDDLFGDFGA
jgi:MraZ protein